MNTATVRTTHPLVIIAALAVTLFSIAGIAALMGWLPSSKGESATPAAAATTPAAEPARTAAAAESREATPAHRSAQHTKTSRPHASAPALAEQPRAEASTQVAAAEVPPPPPAPVAAAEAPKPPVCNDCGMVESVRALHREGSGSGIGAAAGGVLGGVVGHQLGNGRGRDLMTVVGAVGGALAGNQVEKNRNSSTVYETTVRFDDGTTQRLSQAQAPAWRQGDRVRVVNGSIRLM